MQTLPCACPAWRSLMSAATSRMQAPCLGSSRAQPTRVLRSICHAVRSGGNTILSTSAKPSSLDILADHVIIHQNPGFTRQQVANVRKATEQNTPIRLLVRDVHDTHKHGPLERCTATIKTGERPKLERRGGVFQADAFQNDSFQVGTPALEIVQDDGTKHLVENVIADSLAYWEGELKSLGL
jgi:hypothetical protein